MADVGKPPDACHDFGVGDVKRAVYCYVSKKTALFKPTREGTFCFGSEVYLFEIRTYRSAAHARDNTFILTKEEYFQYKLNGFFDDYEMRYRWEEDNNDA